MPRKIYNTQPNNIPNDTVRLHLDLSSSHVTWNDMTLLSQDSDSRECRDEIREYTVPCTSYKYGVIVFVVMSCDTAEEQRDLLRLYREDGYSEAFCNLIKLAWKTDADMIRLDCDGTVDDNLPTFEWDQESNNAA